MKKKTWKRGPHTKTILNEIKAFYEGKFRVPIKRVTQDNLILYCPLSGSSLSDVPCDMLCGKVWPKLRANIVYRSKKRCHCPCTYFPNSHKKLIEKLKEFKLL